MKPQFKNVKFATRAEFNKWLTQNTYKIIELQDHGQDMQKIWIHETGEILNCDFSSTFYNGKFIDVEKLNTDFPIEIWDDETENFHPYHRLLIDSITQIKVK